MNFEKLRFKEIINGDQIEYQVNDKYVTKEVYDSLLEDDSMYILPPLPKMNGSPENVNKVVSINKNSINNLEDDYSDIDEETQELLTIISDIREMDDNEALEGLGNYIEAIRIKTSLETSSQIYNELGNSMIKVSARLEDQLENYIKQFPVEDE